MMRAELSDMEVATRVRMLLRSDLDHEYVCVLARDRIKHLSQRVADMTRALEQCRVILANDQWGSIYYMEGSRVYHDLRRGVEIIDAALASSDSK